MQGEHRKFGKKVIVNYVRLYTIYITMVYLYYTNWVRNQLAADTYRRKLDLKEAELKEYKKTMEKRYMIVINYMYTMQ